MPIDNSARSHNYKKAEGEANACEESGRDASPTIPRSHTTLEGRVKNNTLCFGIAHFLEICVIVIHITVSIYLVDEKLTTLQSGIDDLEDVVDNFQGVIDTKILDVDSKIFSEVKSLNERITDTSTNVLDYRSELIDLKEALIEDLHEAVKTVEDRLFTFQSQLATQKGEMESVVEEAASLKLQLQHATNHLTGRHPW